MKKNYIEECIDKANAAYPEPVAIGSDPVCAVCSSTVSIRGDASDFCDDPICDACLCEFGKYARTHMLELASRLKSSLNVIAAAGTWVISVEASKFLRKVIEDLEAHPDKEEK